MRSFYLKIFLIGTFVLINSCKEDEVVGRVNTDISVSASQTTIVWSSSRDLDEQINSSFFYDYDNVDQREIETAVIINQDTTIVTATINFKAEFRDKYEDTDILNNTASIKLEQGNSDDQIDEREEDEISSADIIELNQSLEAGLPNFDIARMSTTQMPVQVHIINNDSGNGGLEESQIGSTISRLNTAFRFAKIEFFQCSPPNIINNSDFFNHTKNEEQYANRHDVANVLNIYVPRSIKTTDGKNLGGYAFFPFEDIDRIYVKISHFDRTTLEHEIGHYLSLYHTHSTIAANGVSGSGCKYEGDGICDTPMDPFNDEPYLYSFVNRSCIIDRDKSQFQDLVDNIMSYSSTNCRTRFTNEQLIRMAFSAKNHRANLTCSTSSQNSDLSVEEIWLDDNGNGQYDINTKIKNIGNETTPVSESIMIKYYINNQLVGDDIVDPLASNQEGTETLNNYQFSTAGSYDIKVEIATVSNEVNTSNNSLIKSFQVSVGNSFSDLVVDDIWLDDEGNGQYDINTRIKNIGNEATPSNENIEIKYFIDGRLVGDDNQNPLAPNEEGTEFLSNYQFSTSGTYELKVEIVAVSNEGNTSNNSLSESFQISAGNTFSDLVVDEIWLDDEGNGQYDINTRIKNIGNAGSPVGEDIMIKYFVNNQLVGDDRENPLAPNQDGTEYLNNYQFSSTGSYDIKVEIEAVSNESNTSNNSLTESFQVSTGTTPTPITPADNCASAPLMQVDTEYIVDINVSNYGFASPISGRSSGGNNVRGFWLSFQVPSNWSANHDVKIYDTSSNFDAVFGIKAICGGPFLAQGSNLVEYVDDSGDGGNEISDTNLPGSNRGGTPDDIYHIRIYHYDGSETPNIRFKIIVE